MGSRMDVTWEETYSLSTARVPDLRGHERQEVREVSSAIVIV